MENPQFLKKKYNNLHTSPEVASAANRTEKQTGEKIPQSPEKQIQNYLDRFSEILDREDPEKRQQGIEALKKVLHKELVIKKENIPLDYFLDQEQNIAERLGHGRPEATDGWKERKTNEILQGQQRSLDIWIDYLSSSDAMYPDWAKYWAFRSMTQMGGYDKEKGKFGKRTETSSQPFPTLNIACMAKTIDLVQRHLEITGLTKDSTERQKKEKELSYALNHDSQYKDLLSTENFSKLYTHALEQFSGMSWESLENIAGQWKTYEQGSEPDELYDSLQGYPLEWCTATNIETARDQLEGGDFHVYYSQNKDGISTIPRLAIRMEYDSIAEIRGIEKDQNIDSFINPVLDEKLHEFGGEGESYLKKSQDMKQMTAITEKHIAGQELNKEDLRFLYELDGEIEGFGYEEDPRINEIKNQRDKLMDLSAIFDCKYYEGNLNLDTLSSAEGLVLPEHIGGYLDLSDLSLAKGLVLPNHIEGNLYLNGLTSVEGLVLPNHIGGGLHIRRLSSAEGLVLPNHIGGYLDLRRLSSVEGLVLPNHIEGNLYLNGLSLAEGLVLPNHIGGDLDLSYLSLAKGLVLPEHIGGDLNLDTLSSAEGLVLPEHIGGDLYLTMLSSVEGLVLPKHIGGTLDLSYLSSVEGLVLPNHIEGNLYLNGLSLAKGLVLPKHIEGSLNLNGLSLAEGLVLPEHIGGSLYLSDLSSVEKEKLRQRYPEHSGKIS